MKSLRSVRSVDLAATVAAAVFAIFVALLADSGPLVAAALLPLVLVLPGYALAALLFPPGSVDREFRVVMVACLSIAATVLCGLILQLFVDLSRGVVLVSLAAVTIAAAVKAADGRERRRDPAPELALPRIPVTTFLPVGVAIAIAGIAIGIATGGAQRQLDAAHFSALWLVPKGPPNFPPRGPPVVVGASNQEGKDVDYRLVVRRGASTVGNWDFRLPPGGEWEKTLAASMLNGETAPLVAQLERAGDIYRRVVIELEPPPDGPANG